MNDFFANLYELFVFIPGYSQDLYNSGIYVTIGILMLTVSVTGIFIYYYLVNHPRFNRWWQWLLVITLLAAINFGIAWAMSDAIIWGAHNQTIPYPAIHFITFAMFNALWSVVFSFVFSMALKCGSRNAKHSPF